MIEKSYNLRVKEASAAKNYSKNNEYYTPIWVIKKTVGVPDYDPATNKEKAEEFGVKCYDTVTTNGLIQDWSVYNNIWINPPFTLKKEFFKKAVETIAQNKEANIYILVPIESLTTKWFYDLNLHYDLFLPRGRIKFEDPRNQNAKSPAFGSVVIHIGKSVSGKIINISENY